MTAAVCSGVSVISFSATLPLLTHAALPSVVGSEVIFRTEVGVGRVWLSCWLSWDG